jgi:hypothetical protein
MDPYALGDGSGQDLAPICGRAEASGRAIMTAAGSLGAGCSERKPRRQKPAGTGAHLYFHYAPRDFAAQIAKEAK